MKDNILTGLLITLILSSYGYTAYCKSDADSKSDKQQDKIEQYMQKTQENTTEIKEAIAELKTLVKIILEKDTR